jgi:hypothetical protein
MGHSLARPEARAESERQAGAFFDDARAAGLRAVDVNDAFYALQRVARWASANARKTAPATQLAPFATGLFVDAAWGVPTVVRYSSPLHWQVLDHLAPDLAAVPLAKGKRRTLLPYLNLAQSAARRLRRPSGGAGGPAPQVEWLETLRHDFAATCEELDRAAVWDVVDREALLRLLLDDDPQARRRDGEAIYGVMTLLEHERSRTVA